MVTNRKLKANMYMVLVKSTSILRLWWRISNLEKKKQKKKYI